MTIQFSELTTTQLKAGIEDVAIDAFPYLAEANIDLNDRKAVVAQLEWAGLSHQEIEACADRAISLSMKSSKAQHKLSAASMLRSMQRETSAIYENADQLYGDPTHLPFVLANAVVVASAKINAPDNVGAYTCLETANEKRRIIAASLRLAAKQVEAQIVSD